MSGFIWRTAFLKIDVRLNGRVQRRAGVVRPGGREQHYRATSDTKPSIDASICLRVANAKTIVMSPTKTANLIRSFAKDLRQIDFELS